MDESSDIVTFGPSTSMVEEQDTERHNIVDTEYNLKDKQEQRDDFLELFKGQLNEFNHSLVRGFDVMSNQMQNLIGIMSRKTDDSQDMSRRQVAEPINRVEANSNVENRQERNIAHSTPYQIRDVNSNNWRDSMQEKSKMKPQNYDGKEDLEEYLTQFELISELNNWGYKSKSLYLAGNLTGDARGLINELNEHDRRDFDAIVNALKNRFGSIHKAEVFRSELQTRVKGRNESIPELAQSIKKLTRKAYPSANLDVTETLALDYFIDAIPFKEIRIRLREVSPKTVAEAENIAVRLDAVHMADRSRNCNVKAVGVETETNDLSKKIRRDVTGYSRNTSIVEHTIDTGDAKPIKLRPYRIPLSKKLDAEEEIRKMAEIGIIEPSSSAWCAPIVMVTKKDGSIRFCCDFRKINHVTIKDCQPLPRIDDSLAALSGCRWLSTCDLKSGYWQVSVAKEDKHKTAFAIEGGGFWQFKVMPFGLCNSGATFERLMEKVLAGLSWKICLLYLDDIIIFSKTFDEHMDHLDQVFNRLGEANLKLSPKKCHLLRKEVTFLGHTVSENGIATDEEKIKAVKDWPIPKNVNVYS
ncbi:Hypothetical predicted protein [Mytilus galloprovincialis]|uniref:Reverse transcriptase domain-containing protein n=1 Tax=Mytilus galloprovincialis TaxID=29158 RepID=A0A8B6D4S1_MYTGA|nr:Hypothetical predicted protein [Mytilus galloprovincialis]